MEDETTCAVFFAHDEDGTLRGNVPAGSPLGGIETLESVGEASHASRWTKERDTTTHRTQRRSRDRVVVGSPAMVTP